MAFSFGYLKIRYGLEFSKRELKVVDDNPVRVRYHSSPFFVTRGRRTWRIIYFLKYRI